MEYTKEQCESEIAVWQERLENVKPNLISGTWYKVGSLGLSHLVKYSGDHCDNYGIWNDTWRTDLTLNPNLYKTISIATHLEIKEALVKEAKKRGFIFDCYTLRYQGDAYGELIGASSHVKAVTIFNQGEWLDPIPTHTQKELEEIVGYKFKIK